LPISERQSVITIIIWLANSKNKKKSSFKRNNKYIQINDKKEQKISKGESKKIKEKHS